MVKQLIKATLNLFILWQQVMVLIIFDNMEILGAYGDMRKIRKKKDTSKKDKIDIIKRMYGEKD